MELKYITDNNHIGRVIRDSNEYNQDSLYNLDYYLSAMYTFSDLVMLQCDDHYLPIQVYNTKKGKACEQLGGYFIEHNYVYTPNGVVDPEKWEAIMNQINKDFESHFLMIDNIPGDEFQLVNQSYGRHILEHRNYASFDDYKKQFSQKERYNRINSVLNKGYMYEITTDIDPTVTTDVLYRAREAYASKYSVDSNWNKHHLYNSMQSLLAYLSGRKSLVMITTYDESTKNTGYLMASQGGNSYDSVMYLWYTTEENDTLLKFTFLKYLEWLITNQSSRLIDGMTGGNYLKGLYKFKNDLYYFSKK